MANNKKLGKGLDAIFGGDINSIIEDIEKNTPKSSQITVSLDQIRPNPYQPRKVFDEVALQELSESILQHGVFQPVILKKSIKGYEIVAGERRCRASKLAGLTDVPAIVVEFDDKQMIEVALLENIQRENLNAIEEAQAYKQMMDKLNLTQEALSKSVGKSRTYVTNVLRLLNLPEKIQSLVLSNELSMGHARALITLDENKAIELANRCVKESLTVREIENIIKGIELSKSKQEKPKVSKSKEFEYAESLLRKKFRTKVKVDEKTISFKYGDLKDLNRIMELMGVIEEI